MSVEQKQPSFINPLRIVNLIKAIREINDPIYNSAVQYVKQRAEFILFTIPILYNECIEHLKIYDFFGKSKNGSKHIWNLSYALMSINLLQLQQFEYVLGITDIIPIEVKCNPAIPI
jgi:hypothetical protein